MNYTISKMLTFNTENIQKSKKYIFKNCRDLEKARFSYLFENGSKESYLSELIKYQNNDGGFGKELEPDFLLPLSSPLATSIAFQSLEEIGFPESESIIRAVQYLENTFVEERKGWFAVPKEVNDYPRAVWWNWDINTKQTVIDQSWGNPTAELLGYLYHYKKYINKLNIDELIDNAVRYFNSKNEFKSEHEVYCYIRLYRNIDNVISNKLLAKLQQAIMSLVTFDQNDWLRYTPQPLNFAEEPNSPFYQTVSDGISNNLDFLINSINNNGTWNPNWTWHQFDNIWNESKIKWKGIITVRNFKLLRSYNRIMN